MIPQFFRVSDDTACHRDFPWIMRIVRGTDYPVLPCPECGALKTRFQGDLAAVLEDGRGRQWPDVLGCGAYPLLVVSERVLEAWRNDEIGEFPIGGRVICLPPLPSPLKNSVPSAYFWLDGEKMLGAKLDFEASGYVGVQFCSTCGRRWDNVSATYDRQHAQQWSYTILHDTWSGSHLFTTDLSPSAFFCTSKLVEGARRHRHSNFRFMPANATQKHPAALEGGDYIGHQWPPQPDSSVSSEGESVDRWLSDLACGDPAREYDAVCAILAHWNEAVPRLIALLGSDDKRKRLEAARMLASRNDLDVGVEEVVKQIYQTWIRDIVQEYGEEAIPIFVNELKSGPDIKRRLIVDYLKCLRTQS